MSNVGFTAEDCVFDVLDVIAMILRTFPCRQVALLIIEASSGGDAISFEIQNESESTGLLLLLVQRG